MVDGCCENMTKFFMFFCNILVALCGLAILIVGAVVLHQSHDEIVGGNTRTISIVLIVIGSLVFLIAFFGFCGSIMENSTMLLTFAILLTILVVVEIAMGILAVTHQSNVQKYLEIELIQNFNDYKNHDYNAGFWDHFQITNKCCGLYGPMDYDHYLKPASCCGYLDSREHCYNARQTGCEHILMMYYNKFSKILAGTAIGLGCLQIIGVIFACYLLAKFR